MRRIGILLLALALCACAASAETAVRTDLSGDASTCAFPVSGIRAIRVENGEGVLFRIGGDPAPQPVYVIREDTAHLRLELTAEDDPAAVSYCYDGGSVFLQDLLNAECSAYEWDQTMPDPETGTFYVYGALAADGAEGNLPSVYLIPDDAYIEPLAEEMRSRGLDVAWEYGDSPQPEQSRPEAYLLHIVDQFGAPVPGTAVTFCLDTACTLRQADENGTVVFDGEPDLYHVQVIQTPEGCSFDAGFELNTGRTCAEWRLRVRRDIPSAEGN